MTDENALSIAQEMLASLNFDRDKSCGQARLLGAITEATSNFTRAIDEYTLGWLLGLGDMCEEVGEISMKEFLRFIDITRVLFFKECAILANDWSGILPANWREL